MKRTFRYLLLFSLTAAMAGISARLLWFYTMVRFYQPEVFIVGFGVILIGSGVLIAGFWHKLSPVEKAMPTVLPELPEFSEQHGLSPAETEVLQMLVSGKQNAEIAEARHVSLNTVKTHLSNIYQKTGARHRTELMAMIRG